MNIMNISEIKTKYDLPEVTDNKIRNVNAHIHSPYSFSSFSSVSQAVELAKTEQIRVLGINDFTTIDGYDEFEQECKKQGVFPLFNIEFMGLIGDFQKANIRVNDPSNPGRVYFCGKGLNQTVGKKNKVPEILDKLKEQSNAQVKEMINLLNGWLLEKGIHFQLDFEDVKAHFAKELVRERHVAKAINHAMNHKNCSSEGRKYLFKQLYGGKECKADLCDPNAVENEIRSNLLKKGGPAFVPEDENAFLSIEQIKDLILIAGGVPCYPVLLDDKNGNFTEFEGDWEKMDIWFQQMHIPCIELIPGRNSLGKLGAFVRFFHERNYLILFGTEHNTPAMVPLSVSCRGGVAMTDDLLKIAYESACVIAAHQFLVSKGEMGYMKKDGSARTDELKDFIHLGNMVIKDYLR